jgi:hypothetical protein
MWSRKTMVQVGFERLTAVKMRPCRVALLAVCFMPVSCLAYSSTLKMEGHIPPKHFLTFNGLHGVVFQKA